MPRLKFATFNVENLFGRAKVFNFYNHKKGDEKIKIIYDLKKELFNKSVYNKPELIKLYKQVKDYIKFNVTRRKPGVSKYIIYKRRGQYMVSPNGCEDWDGFIEYKRDKFKNDTMKNIEHVIEDVNADVICMIEVENRKVLSDFNSDRLKMYPNNMLIDGNDYRGIDVSIYSKLKFGNIRTNIFDGTPKSRTFSRDCLEVEVITNRGQSIYFLVNHFKSKSGKKEDSDKRRHRQAKRVKEILKSRYDLSKQFVVVAGDFNDIPNSSPLQPLLGDNHLHDVLELQYPNQLQERWTYVYKKKKSQIDYILVSDPLKNTFHEAGIERRGIDHVDEYTNGQIKPYKKVKDWRTRASDHGAVWAEFDL